MAEPREVRRKKRVENAFDCDIRRMKAEIALSYETHEYSRTHAHPQDTNEIRLNIKLQSESFFA